MTLTYNGAAIDEAVDVRALTFDERDEGRLPLLEAEFSDEDGLWDSWGPAVGDGIDADADGAYPTGALSVSAVAPVTGGYRVEATPLGAPDERRTQQWEGVPLRRIAAQVADQLGLGVALHGCPDTEFERFSQECERGLSALTRAAALCGCLLDVHDGTLTVYGRGWAESQASCGALEIEAGDEYALPRRAPWGSCELSQDASGGRRAMAASSGAGGPVLRAALPPTVAVASSAALADMASGVLAHANARRSTGWARRDGLCPYTPGSVVDVECGPAPSASGRGIVTRVRNDFSSNSSKVWWRPI